MPLPIDYIVKKIRPTLTKVESAYKDIATDVFVDFVGLMHQGNYKAAYSVALKLYRMSNTPVEEARSLFHHLVFAEDVVASDSVVFIHKDSPFRESLMGLSRDLGFAVQQHQILKSYWTKDYMISLGDQLVVPVKDQPDGYFTEEHQIEARANMRLYYGPLNMKEHHQAKANIRTEDKWTTPAQPMLIQSNFAHKTLIEGGNFFCAVNKLGNRFYLLGENVVSDTMAYNHLSRTETLELIREELGCTKTNLLIIPQWTYHLDLQMAYLGRGQFVIHSFKQQDIDFGLSPYEIAQCTKTFNFLEQQFEANIIDETINILTENGFEAHKVFGCLFFLNDVTEMEQQKYIPYCKSSEDFDGALALMMNGIAVDLEDKGRHFLTALCDLVPFRKQYEESLAKLNITLHAVDMLGAYDYSGFEGMTLGVWGAENVTQVSAFMNGALRCQTSVISKALCKEHNLELSRHQFFKSVERLGVQSVVNPDLNSEPDTQRIAQSHLA
ncbi:hypothetical protein [uncultured Legionella sp.]|uniref:hypothetical protein n=1 Tax=uncultured Legionella sp. TaxID=210934 RepID=UPI0026276EEC|nr:hypothetical protein [uncultured Legionella sp.]